jgi:hypothetical protein
MGTFTTSASPTESIQDVLKRKIQTFMLPAELTRLFTSVLSTMAAINSWGQRNSVRRRVNTVKSGTEESLGTRYFVRSLTFNARLREQKNQSSATGTCTELATVTFRHYIHHVSCSTGVRNLTVSTRASRRHASWRIATVWEGEFSFERN